jgi:hypothetical protein
MCALKVERWINWLFHLHKIWINLNKLESWINLVVFLSFGKLLGYLLLAARYPPPFRAINIISSVWIIVMCYFHVFCLPELNSQSQTLQELYWNVHHMLLSDLQEIFNLMFVIYLFLFVFVEWIKWAVGKEYASGVSGFDFGSGSYRGWWWQSLSAVSGVFVCYLLQASHLVGYDRVCVCWSSMVGQYILHFVWSGMICLNNMWMMKRIKCCWPLIIIWWSV